MEKSGGALPSDTVAEISRLKERLKELEQENLELKRVYEELKRENRHLGLEIDRLFEEMTRMQERLET